MWVSRSKYHVPVWVSRSKYPLVLFSKMTTEIFPGFITFVTEWPVVYEKGRQIRSDPIRFEGKLARQKKLNAIKCNPRRFELLVTRSKLTRLGTSHNAPFLEIFTREVLSFAYTSCAKKIVTIK